ncbi:hypothetical protein CVIRNUC_007429 [Coccomyxa viridis]|uniref:50S ribosomal protein L34, chloroplastic n=1 Tax=Coccomyxa viridis TaxID=1274662 RepID=A0AAV1ICJ7_9CHLO|nr:hypothetical protein CVIRNUC_007429 [Coccomyxa viridis]
MQMPCAGACAHRLSLPRSAIHRAPLQKAFLGGFSSLCSTRSTFAGTTLSISIKKGASSRSSLVVEANSKTSIGLTKRGTRRARTRTSGFRARMQTPSGRAVLRARRKKGRHTLCPASNYRK